MNGRVRQPPTLEIELTPQEGVSLDDVLRIGSDQPEDEAARVRSPPPRPAAVVGTLTGMDESGRPLVAFSGGAPGRATAARSTVALGENDVGRQLVVVFEDGDVAKPIIVGLIQPSCPAQPATAPEPPAKVSRVDAKLDGERIVLSADREIVFRCGEASITLTRAGKVLIRGAYLLSRSSGVNRIKGGSVQIN